MGPSSPLRGRDGNVVEMGNEEIAEHTEPIPDMRPWRQMGWIFRDGDAQAVERQGNRTDRRAAGRDE